MAIQTATKARIKLGSATTWIDYSDNLTGMSWSRLPDLRRVNQGAGMTQTSLGTYTSTLGFTVDDNDTTAPQIAATAGKVSTVRFDIYGDGTLQIAGQANVNVTWTVSRTAGRTFQVACTFSGEPTVNRPA